MAVVSRAYEVPPDKGEFLVVTVGNPAVASGWTYSLPANYEYEIVSIRMTLVTDANVANRYSFVSMRLVAGALSYVAGGSGARAITAGQTKQIYFQRNYHAELGVSSNEMVPLPRMEGQGGTDELFCFVSGIQAGDQISNIRIQLRRWATG